MIELEVIGSEREKILRVTFKGGLPHTPEHFANTVALMHRQGQLPDGEVLEIEFLGGTLSFEDGLALCQAVGLEYWAFAVKADEGRSVTRYTRDPARYRLGALRENCSPR